MKTPRLVREDPKEVVHGTGIRVGSNGTKERIPLLAFQVGDTFMDERTGIHKQIVLRSTFFQTSDAARFRFVGRGDDRWYEAINYRGLTLHFLLDPPTSPFGRRGEKQKDERADVPIEAVFFLHIVEPLMPDEKEELGRRFAELAEVWRRETMAMSSATQMTSHPAYREIVGLGFHAVPLMLAELTKAPEHWFAALRELTYEDPVPQKDAGRMHLMSKHWIGWGKSHCLLPE